MVFNMTETNFRNIFVFENITSETNDLRISYWAAVTDNPV